MVKPNEVVYRLLRRLPIRMLSLRTIVIVAALAVVILVLTLGTWVWVGVTNDQYSQLDRRLDSVSSLGDLSSLLSSPPAPGAPSPDGNLVRTVRVGAMTMSVPADIALPALADGYANTTINGVEYRVRTISVAGASIALGAPVAETQRRIAELHWRVVLICGGVIIGTVVVGWFFTLIMIDPFRLLAQPKVPGRISSVLVPVQINAQRAASGRNVAEDRVQGSGQAARPPHHTGCIRPFHNRVADQGGWARGQFQSYWSGFFRVHAVGPRCTAVRQGERPGPQRARF
jgi:hypothetical protein